MRSSTSAVLMFEMVEAMVYSFAFWRFFC
jgi:hypothetical protein